MPKSARASHSMKVGLWILGEVKIDDNIHCLDVDTSCEKICKKIPASILFLKQAQAIILEIVYFYYIRFAHGRWGDVALGTSFLWSLGYTQEWKIYPNSGRLQAIIIIFWGTQWPCFYSGIVFLPAFKYTYYSCGAVPD